VCIHFSLVRLNGMSWNFRAFPARLTTHEVPLARYDYNTVLRSRYCDALTERKPPRRRIEYRLRLRDDVVDVLCRGESHSRDDVKYGREYTRNYFVCDRETDV